jgi:DNA-binding CsgD family transcriptional regulator
MPMIPPQLRYRHEHILVRDAAHIIDALNEAIDQDEPPDHTIRRLLVALQDLLRRRNLTVLLLLEDLQRIPVPLVVKRFVEQPTPDQRPVLEDAELQAGMDRAMPLAQMLMQRALSELRTPYTIVCSEDAPAEWFRDEYLPRLTQAGYCDCMVSGWAASPDHAMTLSIVRQPVNPPFSESDRTLLSLMLRAMAPMVDRDVIAGMEPLSETLSERQREILMFLLAGESEKSIATKLERSHHTVHTYIKKIYHRLGVSSRGELMAMFIDREVLRRAAG